jgi:hypothetical protein
MIDSATKTSHHHPHLLIPKLRTKQMRIAMMRISIETIIQKMRMLIPICRIWGIEMGDGARTRMMMRGREVVMKREGIGITGDDDGHRRGRTSGRCCHDGVCYNTLDCRVLAIEALYYADTLHACRQAFVQRIHDTPEPKAGDKPKPSWPP